MSDEARVLLIDDDRSLLRITEKQLAIAGFAVTAVTTAEEAIDVFEPCAFDVVLTDIQLPGMDGLGLLAELKRIDPEAAVVVMTAYGSVDRAVLALKTGALDFLEKPFPPERLLHSIEQARRYRALAAENLRLHLELESRFSFEGIVGGSPSMLEVFRTVSKVARSNAPILVRGESGTGKELLAHAIHHESPRSRNPFVPVNCAAIPDTLIEAELFGHAKGAFTGAMKNREGRFREAHGGTLFLDEIGEIRPDVQAKLLRVLQDGEVRSLGASETHSVDVRLVTATNRDLEEAIREKQFRNDLFYRIAVVSVELPPLRRRRDDIPLLLHHFLREKGAASAEVDRDFLAALEAYSWPGNVRELENVVERALLLREDPERLSVEDLPARVIEPSGDPEVPDIPIPDEGVSLEEIEKSVLRAALEKAGGNQSEAARLLRLTRFTFIYRMKKHGLG